MIRNCRYCGDPFNAIHQNEQVCSDACRLWRNVNRGSVDECWPWVRFIGADGYARSLWPNGKSYYAHRLAVEVDGREIPPGFYVDHICRNRRCCNPAHLRIVPPGVNATENSDSPSARNKQKTKCIRGHELTGENLAIQIKNGKPKRRCRACAKMYYKSPKQRTEAAYA